MEENEDVIEKFYHDCAELLDCAEHVYKKFPYRKRTRWNNRTAGNGRFVGHGLIRVFAPNTIAVFLHTPKVRGTFASMAEVLSAIKLAMGKSE